MEAEKDVMIVGIDGGGTGCRALLCDRLGRPIGAGRAGSANIFTNFDLAIRNILDATRQALSEAGAGNTEFGNISAYLGLAGGNIDRVNTRLRQSLPFKNSIVATDAFISLEGALGADDGTVAVLGTGTVYISRHGAVIKSAGGWGLCLSDHGSGAWLGRNLLEETILCHDGIYPHTELSRFVLANYGDSPQAIVDFDNSVSPGELGKLAPIIFEHFENGDALAGKIIARAVRYIEDMITGIQNRDDSNLCLLGGLGPLYANFLSAGYKSRLCPAAGDAVSGAARLAVRHFGEKGGTNGC